MLSVRIRPGLPYEIEKIVSDNISPNYDVPSVPTKVGFFSGVVAELRQVEWPARELVFRSLGIIVGICVFFSVFVAGLDFILSAIMVNLGEMI